MGPSLPRVCSEGGDALGAPKLVVVRDQPAPPRRVLIVDDREEDAFVMRRYLKKAAPQLQVETVESAQEALVRLRTGHYHAALVDYRLGPVTGTELIAQCRATGIETPMVILTGQGGTDVDIEAMRKGASDYLEKASVTPALLERSIRYAMEQASAQRSLLEARNRFEAAIVGSNDGIWDWDLSSGALFLSPRFNEMLGLANDELLGSFVSWMRRIHPTDRQAVETGLEAAALGETQSVSIEHRVQHRDATWRWVFLRGKLQRRRDGAPLRLAGSQTDITERKAAEVQSQHAARHDSLTGLPNRALLLERLPNLADRLRRTPDAGFTILYLDLDGFKPINDEHGHAAGDAVLVETSTRLRAAVPDADTVARIGGDEFVVLLDRCDDAHRADVIASRVRTSLSAPIQLPAATVEVGASIGIRVVREAVEDPFQLLLDADRSMYAVKTKRGAGRFSRLARRQRELRATMTQWLTDTLEAEEVRAHFQPIVCAQSRAVVGYEALARWTHEGEPISPAEFLPVARDAGLLDVLGRSMLGQACRWIAGRGGDMWVSVNVDASSLSSPAFVETVEAALCEADIAPSRLRLELTEHEGIDDLPRAAANVRALSRLGVELALDDFGTGYSGIGTLLELPVSCIKLDRSMIVRLEDCEESRRVVGHIVQMAHMLGKVVVAEGIETVAQLEAVRSHGVDQAQGYLFGRAHADWPAQPPGA